MSSVNCKAITKSGERCKLQAGSSGYCHVHDPQKVAEREDQLQSLGERYKFEIPTRNFSQRRGLKAVSEVIQLNNMSKELRNSLWNVLSANFLREYAKDSFSFDSHYYYGKSVSDFIKYIWRDYFKEPLDHLPESSRLSVEGIFNYFQKCP